MPHPKESLMRRFFAYFGIGTKRPSVRELEARANAVIAKRRAQKTAKAQQQQSEHLATVA